MYSLGQMIEDKAFEKGFVEGFVETKHKIVKNL